MRVPQFENLWLNVPPSYTSAGITMPIRTRPVGSARDWSRSRPVVRPYRKLMGPRRRGHPMFVPTPVRHNDDSRISTEDFLRVPLTIIQKSRRFYSEFIFQEAFRISKIYCRSFITHWWAHHRTNKHKFYFTLFNVPTCSDNPIWF